MEEEVKRRKLDKPHRTSTKRSSVSESILLLLVKTKASDLHTTKKIFSCCRDDSLTTVMKTLSAQKIQSLPVLTKSGKFWGFVDILDVIKYIVDLVGEGIMSKEEFDLEALDDFKKATVRTIMVHPVSKISRFHPIMDNQSLISVCEILSTGVHRVPVINEKQELVNIISQSSFLAFIHQYINEIGEKRRLQLRELTPSNHVLSVNQHDKAIDSFKLMKICNVSGLAIVSNTGRLIGNISANDIKRITSTARWVSRLFKESQTFIQREPISLKSDDTLEALINTLVKEKVHRVYVVNSKHVPVGVFTITDVLKEILSDSPSE